jgi:hypothetical protein
MFLQIQAVNASQIKMIVILERSEGSPYTSPRGTVEPSPYRAACRSTRHELQGEGLLDERLAHIENGLSSRGRSGCPEHVGGDLHLLWGEMTPKT